jgi:hypothetical protein
MASIIRSAQAWFGLAAIVLLAGCSGTEQRKLLVSEVGTNRIELYLDEATTRALTLGSGYSLQITTATGTSSTVGLGAFNGNLRGGEFLIVWEDGNHTGPPVAAPFSGGLLGNVPGIKVESGVVGDIRNAPGEVRLKGSRNRVSGLLVIFPLFTKDVVDDVVRFGLPSADRPSTGGTFAPNSTLGNPSGSVHLQRFWGASAPIDTNSEADWQLLGQSWGARTQ